jgi:hypothetical protein
MALHGPQAICIEERPQNNRRFKTSRNVKYVFSKNIAQGSSVQGSESVCLLVISILEWAWADLTT